MDNDEKSKEMNEAILNIIDTSISPASSLEIDKITKHMVKILPRILKLDSSIVRLLDARNPRLLRIEAHSGFPKSIINKTRYMRIGVGIEGESVKNKSYVLIKDVTDAPKQKCLGEIVKYKIRSILCVPIIFDSDVYGTITIYSKEKDTFRRSDLRLLRSFCNMAGITLKNAYLYKNVKENYMNTVNSLALIIESRDPYMRGHSERVTYLAIEVARCMNMPESDLHILRTAGKLHDIGKITISDRILSKKDRLAPSEWAQIHLHPVRGVEIVRPLKFLESGLSLIKHHHERYDGSGYPDGLSEDSIPILARILSVADAFDAMTSTRPYRRPFAFQRAIDEIKSNSGTQFDPEVVASFLDIIGKIR